MGASLANGLNGLGVETGSLIGSSSEVNNDLRAVGIAGILSVLFSMAKAVVKYDGRLNSTLMPVFSYLTPSLP